MFQTDASPNLQLMIERILALCHRMDPEPTDAAEKLVRLAGVKAVLFDVYGTLFISGSGDIGTTHTNDNAAALKEAFLSAGFSFDHPEAAVLGANLLAGRIQQAHAKRREEGVEYPEVEIRDIWKDVLSDLMRKGFIRGPLDPEAVMRLSVEYEFRVNPAWPMPALKETLDALRKKDLLLGIVSNAQFYTSLLFRAFLGGAPEEIGFKPPLCVRSYEALEAKPSIRLFRRALDPLEREYGVTPGETLYVGNDRLNDIWPAARAGCRTALFAGDRRSLRLRMDDPRCRAAEPDLVITDLRQLLDTIA